MLMQTTAVNSRPFGRANRPYPRAAISEELLGSLVAMIGRQFSLYMDAHLSSLAEENGMQAIDFKALAFIVEFQSLPTGQLVRLMGLSPGGTTALINRLESGGFITRDRDKRDRRVVALKPVAERCAGMVFSGESLVQHISAAAECYREPELECMRDFLMRCMDGLKGDMQRWLASAAKEDHA